jgi:streptogramin lyase
MTRRILATVVLIGVLAACTPAQRNPDGTVPQDAPIASNGITSQGTELIVCDLFGGQLVRFDPTTGRISERWGRAEGMFPPDDVIVAPDGTIVFTSPSGNFVGQIRPGGVPEVLAYVGQGVNPIVLEPSGTSVLVGFAFQDGSQVIRIPLDGSPTTVVASGLPALNSFSIGPDGALWAPSGGVGGLLGTGGIVRIDLTTGAWANVAIQLPDGSTGVKFAVAAKWAPGIGLLLLQGIDAAIVLVDPATGATTLYADLPTDIADNMTITPTGKLYATGFSGAIMEVLADRSVRSVPVGA